MAENEITGRVAFFEVKRDARRFNEATLRRKVDAFLATVGAFRGHSLGYHCLSMNNM